MPNASKSFDQKVERILSEPSCKDFILADAKDADMGFGLAAPGIDRSAHNGVQRYRTLTEFREFIREVSQQGLVDIMLMSASTCEVLANEERIFEESSVTPAVRANDTTDIWVGLSGGYAREPSLPFRSTTIDHLQAAGANLGLYSITFNNDARQDREALEVYKAFRLEAEEKDFRHFLEVFAPNAPVHPIADVPRYVNDCIVRTLAGVTRKGRPIFLKIPYFGPAAMEELTRYDPTLIVGILGGSAGTTHDAFHMLADAKKHGARAALFGRKINNAEDQLAFVRFLRLIADEEIQPEEAVKAYHSVLQEQGIPAIRPLDEDLRLSS